MFDLPDAKRVRREDLQSPDSEDDSRARGSADADVRATLNARLASLVSLDFGPVSDDYSGSAAGAAQGEPGQPEFSFRLFASSQGPATKVLLTTVDEDILASSDGTVVTKRPLSFYVRGKLGDEERRRLQYSAVSGAEVLRRSRERAWGLELPWRLVKLSVVPQAQARSLVVASSKPSSAKPSGHETDAKSKRRRPGKKKRIALRIKEKARKEKEAAEAQKKLTKEEHLKEKKKRLNRERKLKRRQKEREKKMSCGGGGIAAPGNPEDGTVSASE